MKVDLMKTNTENPAKICPSVLFTQKVKLKIINPLAKNKMNTLLPSKAKRPVTDEIEPQKIHRKISIVLSLFD